MESKEKVAEKLKVSPEAQVDLTVSPEAQAKAQKLVEHTAMIATIAAINTIAPSGIFQFHTHYDMVRQFHAAAQGKGICKLSNLKETTEMQEHLRKIIFARYDVLKEEFSEEGGIELVAALGRGDKPATLENLTTLLDWICDMIYFLYGLAANLGLPYDTAFLHVHEANMKKVVRLGGPIFREDGKVMKPDGWVGPEKRIWEALLDSYKEVTTIDSHQRPGMPAAKPTASS